MTEIGFYHLTATPLERALPKLLERTLQAGERAVVRTASDERVQALNGLLWTYEERSWLPHGSARDGFADDQPIWLTADDENPNAARFLFLTDGVEAADLGPWTRVFDLFDGRDDAAVAAARRRWKAARDAGHALTYWRQTDRGGWEKAG
ncbi:DNA polymerase III subunit chi [Thalassobaculum fulvum]|uniref:DNA polymerase III subunit chi n=1 Tax=Thalassobaculum fulvum TaxID=1633335 RepID=A0A918XSY0_9PROT|nr:DNA polymerase III subunit chi [Thalassobaculum fulvum]GHD49587.1 DNA polymerase III subunit chi [Thalassobaculum fulvum]